eukprot:3046303-Rhodomonas_salina.1
MGNRYLLSLWHAFSSLFQHQPPGWLSASRCRLLLLSLSFASLSVPLVANHSVIHQPNFTVVTQENSKSTHCSGANTPCVQVPDCNSAFVAHALSKLGTAIHS